MTQQKKVLFELTPGNEAERVIWGSLVSPSSSGEPAATATFA
jgi:hypothetical protein